MQHVFWLRPGLLAGRCGPDLNPWIPAQFAAAGITRVLSVNDGRLVHADDLEAAGMEYACMPLSPNAPPREGDFEYCIEVLPRMLQFLDDAIAAGGKPMIHCTSGKDRTGMLMCYYLCCRESCSPEEAVREVRRVRPIALSAPDYEPFTLQVLKQLQQDDPETNSDNL